MPHPLGIVLNFYTMALQKSTTMDALMMNSETYLIFFVFQLFVLIQLFYDAFFYFFNLAELVLLHFTSD